MLTYVINAKSHFHSGLVSPCAVSPLDWIKVFILGSRPLNSLGVAIGPVWRTANPRWQTQAWTERPGAVCSWHGAQPRSSQVPISELCSLALAGEPESGLVLGGKTSFLDFHKHKCPTRPPFMPTVVMLAYWHHCRPNLWQPILKSVLVGKKKTLLASSSKSYVSKGLINIIKEAYNCSPSLITVNC